MLRLIKLSALALGAALLAAPAGARSPDWNDRGVAVLDAQAVDNRADRIVFNFGRDEGPLTEIRLRAANGSILYRAVEITFGNNQTQTIEGFDRIESGQVGKPIAFDGGDRWIRKVVVYKRPSWSPGRSTVELLALMKGGRPGPGAGGRPGRPALLDSQVVDNRADRIVFNFGRDEGPLAQIWLRAANGSILYRAVEITFGNNQSQTIEGFDRIEPGEEGKPIAFDGGDRWIRKVVVYKRPSWSPGRSTVELLGQRGRR